jgi:endonuclease/exonuclease/phosphatase family metal-dependent hydrolase
MKKKLLLLILALLTVGIEHAQELYVGTYNLRYKNTSDTDAGNGWATRRTYLINFVNFQQPDLLGVQEALPAQMTDMADGLNGYGYVGVGRNDGVNSGEYSAIFYRKERMVLLDNGDFWLSDTPYKPSKGFPSKGGSTSYYRICSWGKFFDKINGTIVYHFNTHMDLDETNRQQSYYLIKKKIQEIVGNTNAPVIITGDYNAVQTEESYKLFYNSGFLYDCYVRTKQKYITNGTCPGFNANNYSTVSGELRRIDHIFVTRAFNINHYGVLNPCYYSTSGTASYNERAYSDHSPVMAKLSFRSPDMAELNTTPPPMVNGVYQISSAQELQAFSDIVSGTGGFTKNTAAKAVLTEDIDMAEVKDWRPIGTEKNPYTGTFNGLGRFIRNLAINTHKSYSGLFGYTSGAIIKNFHISGTLTVAEGTSEHGTVGYASSTTITDVYSALNITTKPANEETKHIGGVAGSLFNSSTITRCSFEGTLNDAGTNTVGGIVGYADQSVNKISHAINYGTVQSKGSATNTGGILGYVNYNGIKISNCVNVGNVSGNQAYGGQIVGRQLKAMTTLPTNLFYLAGEPLAAFGTDTNVTSATGATAVNAGQLASGEICYKLNGDQTKINWYQTLPSSDATVQADPYPVLFDTSLRVWLYEGTYINENPDGIGDVLEANSVSETNSVFHDLSGRKLSGQPSQKGIYIVNGNKYIRK